MKFLIDAQLPRSLALLLGEFGHDAMHVKDLPNAGRTTDGEITAVADVGGRSAARS